MLSPPSVPVLALLGAIAVGSGAGILAWRARPEPGAVPLVWLLVGQSWWATCIVFSLTAATPAETLWWTRVAWCGVMLVPVAWVLFALEYAGRDHRITRRNVALLAVVPAVTVALALTEPAHDLLWIEQAGVAADGTVTVEQGGLWHAVAAGYTYALGVLGVVPIVRLLSSRVTVLRGQSAALLVGILTPWATNVLYNFDAVSIAGTDPTPIAFAVSGVAYLGAIDQFDLFDANPAPTWRAKQYLFDHIHEGAIVVDGHDTIVDINRTGADILDVAVEEALGADASAVLPVDDGLLSDGGRDVLTMGTATTARSYDLSVTPLTDRHEQTLGHVFTLHDVTDYRRHQQRLAVLNRVLRHNIRTEANVIQGYAERTGGETAETITERTRRIVELGEKGRDAVELFEGVTDARATEALERVLDRTLADARDAFPSVTFRLDPPDVDERVVVPDALAVVVANLVENAAGHNVGVDRRVDVYATVTDDVVEVRVEDDGPGIDDEELRVLSSGTETPLSHTSGLGLWLVKWGTECVDGDLEFASDSRHGTIVTATVPREYEPGGIAWGRRSRPTT